LDLLSAISGIHSVLNYCRVTLYQGVRTTKLIYHSYLWLRSSCIYQDQYFSLHFLSLCWLVDMNDTKYDEKVNVSSEGQDLFRQDTFTVGHVDNVDQLQRHLGNRQVQLIAIGGQQAFSPPLRF
jgi:hypothetical protein